LNDMGRIDPMYQFSLDAYIDLFNLSIEKSQRSHKLDERIANLNDYHTYALSLVLLKTPNQRFVSFSPCLLPHPSLYPDLSLFSLHPSLFPSTLPAPGEWEDGCNELQRMLIVRSLRQDRVAFCVAAFIINNLGSRFVEPPVLDMKAVVEDSTTKTPLIFVLSPGVDPTGALLQLAEASGMSRKFHALSLGQGQAPIATRMIKEGVKSGHWVFLANCHLCLSWMPQLDKLVEQLQVEEPHPDFRLWLSSSPHPDFPIAILQAGIKMTTEPPWGVKSNMKRLYQLVTESQFTRCARPVFYRKLLFALCFFHSILLERKKFLQLGWNIIYGFNDSDFQSLMSLYLDEYEEIPWEALKYLIAGVNYGGHVTDDFDRRLLTTYINDYFCEAAVTAPFFNHLPATEHPEVFGQHPNADIASQIAETRTLFDTLLSLQPQVTSGATAGAGAGPSRENKVSGRGGGGYSQRLCHVHFRTAYTIAVAVCLCLFLCLSEVSCLLRPPQAYPSLKPLASWTRDLCQRVEQFVRWAETAHPPTLFWLSGFTFPTGFLTAVLQSSARQHNVRPHTHTELVKSLDTPTHSRDGVFIRGLYLEGAGWDKKNSCLVEAKPMQLVCPIPTIHFKPVENRMYLCPCYYFPVRSGDGGRPSFVVGVDLKSGAVPFDHWIKRGTALLMSLDN
uniref:Uncharacterized protein n=1 Tax=Hucho hucho TaxID=62062 RepID=A0A4W5QKC7_9TELE